MITEFRPHMLPKIRSKRIMAAPALIRQKTGVMMPCTLRIASFLGERCADDDTCVMAHLPAPGKGTSTKVTDLAAVCACLRCHQLLDQKIAPPSCFTRRLWPSACSQR